MDTDQELETESKYLCAACIGESYLQSEVHRDGVATTCDYCGQEGPCITIGDLADTFSRVIEDHYSLTPSEPSGYDYAMSKEGLGDWERGGDILASVIGDAAIIDEEPAEDIRAVLDDRYGDPNAYQVGEDSPYCSDAHYEVRKLEPSELRAGWEFFERSIKQETRFFNQHAEAMFEVLFHELSDLKTRSKKRIVIVAGPGEKINALHRARVFQSDAALEKAIARPDKEVGPPPSQAASAGRMNARGIAAFYGATRPRAALAEVRPPVGSRVVMGRFDLIRPVSLLDVEALRSIIVPGSIFDPEYKNRLEKAQFLEQLSHRISMPIMPDDEVFDYLVTQAIADYLASKASPRIDGIIYPSAQSRAGGSNVVLFHSAARVEELDLPLGAQVTAQTSHYSEDGPETDYWVWEAVPKQKAAEQEEDFPFMSLSNVNTDRDYREPTLRLDTSSVKVHHVCGVNFVTEEHSVVRHRCELSENTDF
ncbi:RES domain-containing protein [Aquitalea sp.]|uniref:RES domain-containing protein n=1 Tax=Aquitalea sp. TaxID=1872623 RepID=UPI00258470F1|nr:RES domain-containing protein [Aquitalea sp.]